MSNSMNASAAIHIGGLITEAGLGTLVAAIVDSGAGLDWGARFHSDAEVIAYVRDRAVSGRPLFLASFEAVGGAFPVIESACRTLGLTYVRGTDCHPQVAGEVVLWWPGMPQPRRWIGTTDEHEPCLSYRRIVELLAAGADALDRELALMKAALDRPDPLQIAA